VNGPESSERAPTPQEVIRRHIDAALVDLRCCMAVVVTAYDASKQKVSVMPLVKEAYVDEEDERQVESLPVITGVPVGFLSVAGFRFTCPISDGNLVINGKTMKATTGVALFSDRSLDKWLSGAGQEVDPEVDHEHALTDAIFIPGLNPFGAPLSDVPTDMASAGSDTDGNGTIDFLTGEIHLGRGATKGVARKDDKAGGGTLVMVGAGTTALTAITVTYTPGDGSAQQTGTINPGGTVTLNVKEKITSASAHVKAVD